MVNLPPGAHTNALMLVQDVLQVSYLTIRH